MDPLEALGRVAAARFNLKVENLMEDFNRKDWSLTRETLCHQHGQSYDEILDECVREKEAMRWFDLEDEDEPERLQSRSDLLPTDCTAQDSRVREFTGRKTIPEPSTVGEYSGLVLENRPHTDHACNGNSHRRFRRLVPSSAGCQVSKQSILWGFVGAGFAAPVDVGLALCIAAVWCFVIAHMKWNPDGSSNE